MVLRYQIKTDFPTNPGSKMDKAISMMMQDIAYSARRKASKNAPYLTGTLRRSITEIVRKGRAYIGSNVPYAKVREYINRKNPHRRFYMRRAVDDVRGEIQEFANKAFNRVFK